MRCLPVASQFMETFRRPYPPHQRGPLIEEAAAQYFTACPDIPGWTYIPVQWTSWFSNNNFGKKTHILRNYLDCMQVNKRTGKYFTVVQNDDGTCCEEILNKAECLVFGAGGEGDIPIPLLCDPHLTSINTPKTKLASFCGSINTHPVRREMEQAFRSVADCEIGYGDTAKFREMISDSLFSLCPRGYGRTSFRLYETIQMGGSIPVYIYDNLPWLPFGDEIRWDNFCVMCNMESIADLPKRLTDINNSPIVIQMFIELGRVRERFTMLSTLQWIERKVRSLPCR